jgi:hypothetical protein
MRRFVRRCRVGGAVLTVAPLLLILALWPPSTAFGVGSGYGPGFPSPPGGGGGFTTIVTTSTVTSAGGTVRARAFGAVIVVQIPAGSLPNSGEIVITAAPPHSVNLGRLLGPLADFAVEILDPNTGAIDPAPFEPGITVTIAKPVIGCDDVVVSSSLSGHPTEISARVTQGFAIMTFDNQSDFVVATPHHEGYSCEWHGSDQKIVIGKATQKP